MNTRILLVALLCMPCSAPLQPARAAHPFVAPEGGPPAVRIAGKAGGDITAAQWSAVKRVDLVGCVPGARIVSLTLCIKDCKSKEAMAGGEDAALTAYQRQMIANLPVGTPFKVQVVVRDEKGKVWEVPDAQFVWKG